MHFSLSKFLTRLRVLSVGSGNKEQPVIAIESNLDIILLFASREKPFTQKELGSALQIDKPRMQVLIEGLKQHRYIFTERNTGDSGDRLILPTYLGKEFVPSIRSISDNE